MSLTKIFPKRRLFNVCLLSLFDYKDLNLDERKQGEQYQVQRCRARLDQSVIQGLNSSKENEVTAIEVRSMVRIFTAREHAIARGCSFLESIWLLISRRFGTLRERTLRYGTCNARPT